MSEYFQPGTKTDNPYSDVKLPETLEAICGDILKNIRVHRQQQQFIGPIFKGCKHLTVTKICERCPSKNVMHNGNDELTCPWHCFKPLLHNAYFWKWNHIPLYYQTLLYQDGVAAIDIEIWFCNVKYRAIFSLIPQCLQTVYNMGWISFLWLIFLKIAKVVNETPICLCDAYNNTSKEICTRSSVLYRSRIQYELTEV